MYKELGLNGWCNPGGFLFLFEYFPFVSLAAMVTFGVPMTGEVPPHAALKAPSKWLNRTPS